MKAHRAILAVILILTFGLGLPSSQERGLAQETGAQERPNIVFILTDDLDTGSVSVMDAVRAQLIEQGTTFDNAFATDPLCCPSRATFLRGQYSHNTAIRGNSAPEGGHAKFQRLGLDHSTVATWLDGAGYDTVFIGKYMNGYGSGTHYVPPGWDRWFGWLGHYHSPGGNYSINENRRIEDYNLDRIHDTDPLRDKAVNYIKGHRGTGPFFMYVATNAPHTPAYVPKRHEGMFSSRSLPRPPSFNEQNISDKPEIVRRPKLSHKKIKELGDRYRKRLASLQSVDDMVAQIIATLRETNQLDNTYIMFASDNGYLLGEHRRTEKVLAYEESIRVPFVVRGPRVQHQRLDHLVTNNDFAPTVAELAGVEPPVFEDGKTVDGKSFAGLLGVGQPTLEEWRTGFLVEHLTPSYKAVRTNQHTYVEWANGEKELYDLQRDPYQLNNALAPGAPPPDSVLLGDLQRQLEALRDCTGEGCRIAETS
jgi:arylsulfatase A-like enzyme